MSDCNGCDGNCGDNCSCSDNEDKTEDKKFEKIFWDLDYRGPCKTGLMYRTMNLGKFIKETEEQGYRIVGIILDETHNCDLIFAPTEGFSEDELKEIDETAEIVMSS